MYSPNGEVAKISTELRDISLKIQQLQERRNIMCIFQEIRNRTNLGQTEEAYAKLQQINIIENELKRLRERQAELQKRFESISSVTYRGDQKVTAAAPPRQELETAAAPIRQELETAAAPIRQEFERKVPEKKVFFVEAPPTYPAPSVILEPEKLPPEPSRTQCPQCQQFVMTETISSISSVTWLVCFMTALLGCVAGCCLIPFCSKKFKSITHRCPKCRTSITTLKKL